MNQFENDVLNMAMYKIACYQDEMEKYAAISANGIASGLGGKAFGRALANGMSNRNGMVFKGLSYAMPDGSGVIGGLLPVKGLNKPFLLDAPITKRIQPVNRMFDADNIINWNLF